MKNTLKKPLSLLFAALLLAVVFSACGVDPNVKQEKKATNDYAVQISGEAEEKELAGFHSYGTGKAELDESGDLLITYTYHSGSVTRLRYHFIDENHVQETSLNTGRTETLTRADSN